MCACWCVPADVALLDVPLLAVPLLVVDGHAVANAVPAPPCRAREENRRDVPRTVHNGVEASADRPQRTTGAGAPRRAGTSGARLGRHGRTPFPDLRGTSARQRRTRSAGDVGGLRRSAVLVRGRAASHTRSGARPAVASPGGAVCHIDNNAAQRFCKEPHPINLLRFAGLEGFSDCLQARAAAPDLPPRSAPNCPATAAKPLPEADRAARPRPARGSPPDEPRGPTNPARTDLPTGTARHPQLPCRR